MIPIKEKVNKLKTKSGIIPTSEIHDSPIKDTAETDSPIKDKVNKLKTKSGNIPKSTIYNDDP